MTKPAILIVGAGATGLPVGYHLSLAGADHRCSALPDGSASRSSDAPVLGTSCHAARTNSMHQLITALSRA
jgi:glycine/D-amino acid oxidase-like deaminating enzyme